MVNNVFDVIGDILEKDVRVYVIIVNYKYVIMLMVYVLNVRKVNMVFFVIRCVFCNV